MRVKPRDIKDVNDFNDCASEIFEAFCNALHSDGFTRPVTEDDGIDPYEGFEFVYTDMGSNLATRMLDRLYKVGCKYFNSLDVDISSSSFIEP